MPGKELALKWEYRSGGLSNSRYCKCTCNQQHGRRQNLQCVWGVEVADHEHNGYNKCSL